MPLARFGRFVTVGLTAVALGFGPVQPVGAAPRIVTGGARPVTEPRATVAQVTLVTGHRVRVSRTADGKQGVSIDAPGRQRADTFAYTDQAGDLHVIPRQALALLQQDKLDRRLFNVTDLVEQGYGGRPDVPLIITYPKAFTPAAVMTRAKALRTAGAAGVRTFGSADAVAVKVPRTETASFWAAMDDDGTAKTAGPALLGGAAKVWLDGKVHATLEDSVPLIGAPAAWAAGADGSGVTVAVLDTGYDPAHPDLAGRVTATRSFGATGAVQDGNGHGTHVAATVAGTGAASGGLRKGVAPGARLMIGKVLDDTGSGDESWVLEGMEWAARQGAAVVSMSLGGNGSDGSDPLSQAVDSLTAETGALFVIAAGNAGPAEETIGVPGAASSALTVGNTTKSDQLNDSSSRGPRLGDHAVKPELTAPGTDIVAARAAGTSLGTPVDAAYTSLTGTSMATPHVAGAAAILTQRYPEWTPEQLKAALVGSAKAPADGTVFAHGAGRLDVAAALRSVVRADRGSLSFGFHPALGAGAEPISRTVTYRNSGTEPSVLDLAVNARTGSGGVLPAGAATVAPSRLVVPAGGTAAATVTVDPALVDAGTEVSGLLIATTNGGSVRTPWSYAEDNQYFDLTVASVGTDGRPSTGWAQLWGRELGAPLYVPIDATGKQTVRVPEDEYVLIGGVTRYDAAGVLTEEALGGRPQLSVAADATVTLDARKANPLSFRTPRPARPTQYQLGWSRVHTDGTGTSGSLYYGGGQAPLPKVSVIPSAQVTSGSFEFLAGGRLVAQHAAPDRTPYLYDLALPTPGRLPADVTFRVRDRELARIDSTFTGVGAAGRRTSEARLGFTPLGRLQVNAFSEVTAAGPRADFVSANGTRWQSAVRLPQPGAEDIATMTDAARSYSPGARLPAKWWGAPYTAGTDSDTDADAYRLGDELRILVRDYQDGDPSHWGDSFVNDEAVQTVKGRLYQGDQLVHEADWGGLVVPDLPADKRLYRYVHTVSRRGPIWTSSSLSESEWTFRSGRESTQWPPTGILPLLDLNWSVPTDSQNRAAARAPFVIGLHARHVRGMDGGTLAPAKLWVSFDDGRRWSQVPLLRRPGDKYVAVLRHPPKDLTTGWVSLRGEIRDADGGVLKQTTIRAYALK